MVVSVLLAFLKQSLYDSDRPTYKRLVKQLHLPLSFALQTILYAKIDHIRSGGDVGWVFSSALLLVRA